MAVLRGAPTDRSDGATRASRPMDDMATAMTATARHDPYKELELYLEKANVSHPLHHTFFLSFFSFLFFSSLLPFRHASFFARRSAQYREMMWT